MKRVMLLLALVIGLGTTQASAQKVDFGVKAEANTSSFILKDMSGMESKLGFGASVGGFAKINLGEYFAIQPELLFHYKNSEMKTKATGAKLDYTYFGAEIPVYAIGHMKLGNGKAYIGAGPYVGFGLDARYKANGADDIKLFKEYDGAKSAMKRWDMGAGVMLGYEFDCGIQINASYKMGFMDALNTDKKNATMRNQTISLGLGYRF